MIFGKAGITTIMVMGVYYARGEHVEFAAEFEALYRLAGAEVARDALDEWMK